MVTNEATQCITATADQCIAANGSMRNSVNTAIFTVYNLSLVNNS